MSSQEIMEKEMRTKEQWKQIETAHSFDFENRQAWTELLT